MNPCGNCGKLNAGESNFCRFCGTKFNFQQPVMDNPYEYSPPRPYAWKTDEFQSQPQRESKTIPIDRVKPLADMNYGAAPLAYAQNQQFTAPFRCPKCMSSFLPRMERRISTAGWIVFAVLLVFFFPLFWIGLLIKEDVPVCQSCNTRVR